MENVHIKIKNMHNINIKLKIFPKEEQKNILDGHSKICNWLYNQLLEKANNLKEDFIKNQNKESAKTVYNKYGLRNLVPKIKEEHKFLNVVYASPLKNTALRLSESIKNHQDSKKGKRKGKPTGWPKFRKWSHKWFSLYYDEPYKGYSVKDGKLILSLGLGLDRKRKSLEIDIEKYDLKNKKVKNLRIKKQHNQYYAIFTAEIILPKTKKMTRYLSLDPNHENLAWGVDNFGKSIKINYPKSFKELDRRIDKVKSKRDKCKKKLHKIYQLDDKKNKTGKYYYKPSRRWLYLDKVLKKMYKKRQDQTKHFLYTLSNKICSEYDSISCGDYTPRGGGLNTGMRRSMNNDSLIGRFKNTLSWLAYKSGKQYQEYNEYNTTKTCNKCDYILEKSLNPKIRDWQCPSCKENLQRDENASLNGFKKSFPKVFLQSSCHVLKQPLKRCTWNISHGLVFIKNQL